MLPIFVLAIAQPHPMDAGTRLVEALAPLHGAFSRDGDTLTFEYKVSVIRPRRRKPGEVGKLEQPTRIPSLHGIELITYDFAHPKGTPARREQAVRTSSNTLRDYGTWKMDARELQILGTDKARYYYLAWGAKVSPKVLAKVRAALEHGCVPIPN